MAPPPPPPSIRTLALATLGAALVAALVLVVAVLPAEYGVDPTGLGARLGLTRLDGPEPEVVAAPETEEAARESYAWSARWNLREIEIGNWTGRLDGVTPEQTIRVALNVTNLTKLTARLSWQDDVAQSGPDTLEVSIRGNGRETDLVQGSDGFANATLAWRRAPYPTEENGTLALDVRPDESGHGEYRIVVRLYGTGATPEHPDEGNGWTLRLHAESYVMESTVDATGAPADRVTLALPPGRGVEYKLLMAEGARMTYRWNATAPLHADLHGDNGHEDDEGVSAKAATLQRDEGAYVAPFAGRHGWYWRNDGAAPVTLTLETRGEYDILGVPG